MIKKLFFLTSLLVAAPCFSDESINSLITDATSSPNKILVVNGMFTTEPGTKSPARNKDGIMLLCNYETVCKFRVAYFSTCPTENGLGEVDCLKNIGSFWLDLKSDSMKLVESELYNDSKYTYSLVNENGTMTIKINTI